MGYFLQWAIPHEYEVDVLRMAQLEVGHNIYKSLPVQQREQSEPPDELQCTHGLRISEELPHLILKSIMPDGCYLLELLSTYSFV